MSIDIEINGNFIIYKGIYVVFFNNYESRNYVILKFF